MTDIITLLKNNNHTLIMTDGEEIFTYDQRGVAPLVNAYESLKDFSSFIAADKVVGRGAAFLYILLKIKKIHAVVISKSALEILMQHHIDVTYDILVPFILNRTRDGYCPMETATMKCIEPLDAYKKIKEKQKELMKAK